MTLTSARTVFYNRVRLLACVALLCGVTACGSQRGRAPATSSDAELAQAMELENVPTSWYDSLHFIMFKESGGRSASRTRMTPAEACSNSIKIITT